MMRPVCQYSGMTPMSNTICRRCQLFLQTCIPIASDDGYAMGSECGIYLCEGCLRECRYAESVNL